jgi:hypothetical protein
MEAKSQILADLTEIFERWQELLAGLSNEYIEQPLLPSDWTLKDTLAHLWFWQQASVARMETAVQNKQPNDPEWWAIFGPDPEEKVDQANAWNYASNRDKPWPNVYADWKTQFQRYLDLLRLVPEGDLLTPRRYAWMGKYSLSASSLGSLDHHREHYSEVNGWLGGHRE